MILNRWFTQININFIYTKSRLVNKYIHIQYSYSFIFMHFCQWRSFKSIFFDQWSSMSIRMNWWNSPRCEFYRSVRNAVKLTKCWEILWSEPFRGLLWPNLWSEAGHIWARTTFPFICCAAGIGLHNCRHYNWLACVQPGLSAQKVNTTVKNNQSVIDASLHIIRNLSS